MGTEDIELKLSHRKGNLVLHNAVQLFQKVVGVVTLSQGQVWGDGGVL